MAMCTKDSLTTTFRRIFTMARTLQDVLALCREKDVKIVVFCKFFLIFFYLCF